MLQPTRATVKLVENWSLRGEGRTGTTPIRRYSNWMMMHPYVSMHVRWGDKCIKEAKCLSAKQYVKAANALRSKFGVRRLVLSSEDPKAILDIPPMLGPGWEILWSTGERLGQQLHHNLPAFNKTASIAVARDVSAQSIVNFYVSAAADYIICTASSNWCRIIVRMACALRGQCPRTVFMDAWTLDFTMGGNTAMKEQAFQTVSQLLSGEAKAAD